MEINAKQNIKVNINPLDVLNRLKIGMVGTEFDTYLIKDSKYFIKYEDDTIQEITKIQYEALVGVNNIKKCIKERTKNGFSIM